MKMKNRSHRYDINRPRSRHEHKYSKCSCIRYFLINIFIFYRNLRNVLWKYDGWCVCVWGGDK